MLKILILSLTILLSGFTCSKQAPEQSKSLTISQKEFINNATPNQKAYFDSCNSNEWTKPSTCIIEILEKGIN